MPSLADRALTDSGLDETVVEAAPRRQRERVRGRKTWIAAAVASFVIGTGAVTALEVARKGDLPGAHGSVFDPGNSGTHDQPAPQYPGGSSTQEGSTPSQKPDSPAPTSSGSPSESPSTTPSTPAASETTPTAPTTPSTDPTSGATTPSTAPTTQPTGTPDPTVAPSTPGPTTAPSSTGGGAGKVTPTGGASS
jgi:hypothetical protein